MICFSGGPIKLTLQHFRGGSRAGLRGGGGSVHWRSLTRNAASCTRNFYFPLALCVRVVAKKKEHLEHYKNFSHEEIKKWCVNWILGKTIGGSSQRHVSISVNFAILFHKRSGGGGSSVCDL